MHNIEIRCVTEPKIDTVRRCVCALSSLEILQAGAVRGLNELVLSKQVCATGRWY